MEGVIDMAITKNLIDKFVEATNDSNNAKSESNLYGTVKIIDGDTFVQIDGSEILTPMPTVTTAKEGDRVKVEIKDHTAVIVGNMTSPSAMNSTVEALDLRVQSVYADIGTFHTLLADKATIGELNAAKAEITELLAGKVTADELEAEIAKIDELIAKKVSTDIFDAKMASVDTLIADRATIGELNAAKADIIDLNAEMADIVSLVADKASVGELNAVKADITNLNVSKANITDLDAANANIGKLDASVGKIDALIFGSASGSTIQTSFANAVIAQLGSAQIKSAMIDNISASKITAGDIVTNNVRVMSDDGSLIISDETLQISDGVRARVQIGKDATGDYSINIWDASGDLMFSKGGITDAAIKDAIIRNDMVAANANISASKLDIDSLFEEINGSSKTIKGTRVYLDEKGQTLDAAFTSMTTDVNGIRGTVESQGTQISVMQGQIANKIWQTDINTTIDKLEIGGRNLIPRQENLSETHNGITVTGTDYVYRIHGTNTKTTGGNYGVGEWMKSNGHVLEPGETYTLSTSVPLPKGLYLGWNGENSAGVGVMLAYLHGDGVTKSITYTIPSDYRTVMYGFFGVAVESCRTVDVSFRIKLEKGNKATDWTPPPEAVEGDISTLSTKYSEVKQTVDGLSTTVAAHTTQISNKADSSTVTTVNNKVSALEQNLDGFKTTVSNTYTTKTEFDNLEIGGRNLLLGSNTHVVLSSNMTYSAAAYSGFSVGLNEIKKGDVFTLSYYLKATNAVLSGSSRVGFEPFQQIPETGGYAYYGCWKWIPAGETFNFEGMVSAICTALTDMKSAAMSSVGYCHAQTIVSGTVELSNFKLEKGNKATDWTPAPEDADGKYGTKTEINQLSDRITANVSETTALGTRMSTVEQKADGLTVSLSNTNSKIDNLEVGGRNLIQKSQIIAHTCVANFENTDSITITYVDSTNSSALRFDTLLSPGVYTINATNANGSTFRLLSSSRIHNGFIYNATYNGYGLPYYFDITDMPYTFTLTAESKLGMVPLYSNGTTQTIHNLKLEKGNKATDWTPAPEDVDNSIANAQSTANAAQSTADTANATANAANTTADTAQSTAQSAKIAAYHSVSLNYAQGKMLYTDPTFAKGSNSMSVYDNSNSGYVTVIRTAKSSDNPFTDSAYELAITNTGYCNPGLGGFQVSAPGKQNATYVWRIVAKIPVGYTLAFASNGVGTGGDAYINLTGMTGTGRFTEYVGKVQYGTGWVSTTGFWYLSGTAGTSSNPVKWYVAYATMWDMTNTADVTNAAKTATNYLNFSNGGLVVGDMTASTLGNNVLIDNDSVDIRNGDKVLASYKSDTIELGKSNPQAVIDLCNGMATLRNNDTGNWNRLGIHSEDAIELDSNSFSVSSDIDDGTGDAASVGIYAATLTPWDTENSTKRSDINIYTYRTNSLGKRSENTLSITDGYARLSNMYRQYSGDDTKTAVIWMGDIDKNIVRYYGINMMVDGKDVFIADRNRIYLGRPMLNDVYTPYYTSGDIAYFDRVYTSGFTANSADVYFTLFLSRPVFGATSVIVDAVVSDNSGVDPGFVLRQNNTYTHGTGSSTKKQPNTYTAYLLNENHVCIKASFASSGGATANSSIGVQWSGAICFI
jgi:hypothetical protein